MGLAGWRLVLGEGFFSHFTDKYFFLSMITERELGPASAVP